MATKRKIKNPAKPIAVYAIVLCASLAAGLAAYVKLTPADKVPAEKQSFADSNFPDTHAANDSKPVSNENQDIFALTSVSIPVAKFKNDELTFEEDKVKVPAKQNSAIYAVNEFLNRSGVADGPVHLESIKLDGKVALLYFNKAFIEQSLGSQDEATLINGVRAVMGQFESIEEIEFFSDGQQVEELGHLELIGPQKVIRPGLWKTPTSHDGTTPIEPQG